MVLKTLFMEIHALFLFSKNLEAKCHKSNQVPINQEATSSSFYVDLATLASSSSSNTIIIKIKVQVNDKGWGEYSMKQSFYVEQLPLSPKTYE